MKPSTTSAALLACCLLIPCIAQSQQGEGTNTAKLEDCHQVWGMHLLG